MKKYHDPESLVGLSNEELNQLRDAGEIDDHAACFAKWRRALLAAGVPADRVVRRQLAKQAEQQKEKR